MNATWTPAYIGVGSNLDEPRKQVERGIASLTQLPKTRVIATSHLYLSKPLGPPSQPDYVNAAVGLLTQLEAPELLTHLKRLEAALGRTQPAERWGPRIIDFDLLMHGQARVATDELQLPHPGIAERAFVLAPLNDIAPTVRVPGLDRVDRLLRAIDVAGVRAL